MELDRQFEVFLVDNVEQTLEVVLKLVFLEVFPACTAFGARPGALVLSLSVAICVHLAQNSDFTEHRSWAEAYVERISAD